MSAAAETRIDVGGTPYRVWRRGSGPRLGVLAGMGGWLAWNPFLEHLAESREVIVPSLPGFPGGGRAHLELDTILDWALATRDILDGAGLDGADLVGLSVGGALAAEVAAIWPRSVGRLVLVAPCGLFDTAAPSADPWAVRPPDGLARLLSAEPDRLTEALEAPEQADQLEWEVDQIRANEAAARLLWPNGSTGLERRLGRISAPTLIVWGEADRYLPAGYADRFAGLIGTDSRVARIAGAGHLVDFDRPAALARTVLQFLDTPPPEGRPR